MADNRVLVLDQGSHAGRAIVLDGNGTRIAEAAERVETSRAGTFVELDAEAVVAGLERAARRVCSDPGNERRRLTAAGLATQRSNILCWRRGDLTPLSPAISWQDRRAGDKLAGLDPEEVQAKTGLVPNAHYGASKLAWCLEHLPPVRHAAECGELMLGPMSAWLAARLTGSPPLVDPVNASRTLLWNIHERGWDEDLCRHFAIDPKLLPAVADSDHGFGSLSLPGDLALPLTIVTGDLSAAAFAAGSPAPDIAYVTLGTGAFVQRITAEPHSHPLLLDSMLWQSGEERILALEGTVNGAGSAFSWLAARHGVDEQVIFDGLAGWQQDVDAPPLFLNAVSGLGSPFWCPRLESRFDRSSSLAEEAVAVLESIVFLLALNLDTMSEVLPAPRRIVAGGGLSRVDGLCRKLAALSGLAVARSGETEGTARGLAWLLSGRPGHWEGRDEVFEATPDAALAARRQAWLAFMHEYIGAGSRYFRRRPEGDGA